MMDLKSLIPIRRRNAIVKHISSNREGKFWKPILKLSEYITLAGKNISYDSSSNGENEIFRRLATFGIKTIIDCGANTGTNTAVYKEFAPNTTVYAIEAIEETMAKCKKFTEKYSGIEYRNIGMGSENTTVIFKYFPNNNYLSTKYENVSPHQIQPVSKEVIIKTGDSFCTEEGISHVDFLKIDVEGMDFEVIKGFEVMIAEGKIDVIQFEYTGNFIFSGHTLKNVYDFFAPYGYIIGKVYPDGVKFMDYNIRLEDFLDANYIIIRTELSDKIEALKEKK